jgi:hypothetical protein
MVPSRSIDRSPGAPFHSWAGLGLAWAGSGLGGLGGLGRPDGVGGLGVGGLGVGRAWRARGWRPHAGTGGQALLEMEEARAALAMFRSCP